MIWLKRLAALIAVSLVAIFVLDKLFPPPIDRGRDVITPICHRLGDGFRLDQAQQRRKRGVVVIKPGPLQRRYVASWCDHTKIEVCAGQDGTIIAPS